MDALSCVFETENVITFDQKKLTDLGFRKDHRSGKPIINLEVDLFTVSQNSVFLIEIKSNPKDVFKAMDQLNRAEYVISELAKTVTSGKVVPLKKVVIIPPYQQRDLELKAKKYNVTVVKLDQSKEDSDGAEKCTTPDITIQSMGVVLNIASKNDAANVFNYLFGHQNQDGTSKSALGILLFSLSMFS